MTGERDGMRLTVVGCAAAWTVRQGVPSSCYLIETDGERLVLDMGQGSFAALSAALGDGREPSSLGAVVISHLHPDHSVDLVALRHYLRYACQPPASVMLHAPAGLRDRYDALLGEHDFLAGLPGHDLAPGRLEVGAFELQVRRVTHVGNSFGFRVSRASAPGAPGLVYSGDIGRPGDLVPLVRASDTLLCEASWGAGEPPSDGAEIHVTARQAAGIARDGGAARLILTHLQDHADPAAALDQARRSFAGDVLVAEPGLQVDIA